MAYNKVTLTGTYRKFDGTPATGPVEIIPSEHMVKDTTGNVILSGRVKVKLDETGSFSVDLPATDDPTLNPTNFGYTVVAKLHHKSLDPVSFSLPAAVPVVDVEDVTTVDPSTFTPGVTYVTAEQLSVKANTADVDTALAAKANTTDVNAALALKANASSLAAKADATRVDSLETLTTSGRLSDTSLSATIGQESGAVKPLPASSSPVTIADSGGNETHWLGADRRTLYRGGGTVLRTSTNDGATWAQANAFTFPAIIVGVRELDDGNVLVSTAASGGVPGRLYRSSGGVGGTFSQVLQAGYDTTSTLVGPSSYFSGEWGMSVHENIVVVSEYGLQRPDLNDQARFVWLSEDAGLTFTRIYDIGTAASAHVHSAFYDPWWDAIWVSQGDSTNRAVKVSFNKGGAWTTVANPLNQQPVGGIALPGCILFGSDYQPDGVYRVPRTPDRANLKLEQAYRLPNAGTDIRKHIGGMPFWTGRAIDPVLIPFVSDAVNSGTGQLVSTLDGYTFTHQWMDTQSYVNKGLWKVVGPTRTGAVIGELADDRGPTRNRLTLSYLAATEVTEPVQRRYGSGSYTLGDVVTVGDYAEATRADTGTVFIAGGAPPYYENVVGGNLANVDTAVSNLAGVPTLVNENGNWVFLMGGYDNVVNGWACVVNGFHIKVNAGANHITVAGGSKHTVDVDVDYGTIGGGTNNRLTGDYSTVAGGLGTTVAKGGASGGGQNHTVSGEYATVAGGNTNIASGVNAAVGGGITNTASGLSSRVGGGLANVASGDYSTVPGGRDNAASGIYSTAMGRGARATNGGEIAHSVRLFAVAGDNQSISNNLYRSTTTATAADLWTVADTPPLIPENTTWAFEALITARRSDADGDNAAWRVQGCFKRDAGNTAALVGTPTVTSLGASAGAATWTVAVASYSVGNLRFVVTGEAGKTIYWGAKFQAMSVSG